MRDTDALYNQLYTHFQSRSAYIKRLNWTLFRYQGYCGNRVSFCYDRPFRAANGNSTYSICIALSLLDVVRGCVYADLHFRTKSINLSNLTLNNNIVIDQSKSIGNTKYNCYFHRFVSRNASLATFFNDWTCAKSFRENGSGPLICGVGRILHYELNEDDSANADELVAGVLDILKSLDNVFSADDEFFAEVKA